MGYLDEKGSLVKYISPIHCMAEELLGQGKVWFKSTFS